jgi:hypothetical protein
VLALWALGVIPVYEIAVGIAVVLALLILWQGVRRVTHASRLSGTVPATAAD